MSPCSCEGCSPLHALPFPYTLLPSSLLPSSFSLPFPSALLSCHFEIGLQNHQQACVRCLEEAGSLDTQGTHGD